MVALDLGREVVPEPDAAGGEQDRGPDGVLVSRGLGEEVLPDDPEPSDVAGGEPVQRVQVEVVAHAVWPISVGREVDVELGGEEDVLRQRLGVPEAAEDREAAVLRGPEAREQLEVRGRRLDRHLRSEVAEEHRSTAHRSERAHLRVERPIDRLVHGELGEGAVAQHEQHLTARLPLGLGGRGDEHRTHEQDREEALHRSLQSGVSSVKQDILIYHKL